VGFVVLITWFAAVLMGLFMLAVWLIENDATDRGSAPSRLPVLVVFAHMFLAAAGLGVWTTYLIAERMIFAWVAIGILGGIAVLGATMFLRWIPVYRHAAPSTGAGQPQATMTAPPAEGNFPVAIVAPPWAARGLHPGPGCAHRTGGSGCGIGQAGWLTSPAAGLIGACPPRIMRHACH